MSESAGRRRGIPAARVIVAALIGLVGLWLFGFGGYLALLGGSFYHVLAGAALLASAILLLLGKAEALVIYAALIVITIIWAMWEVGLDFWQLAPRGDVLVLLGVLLLLPWVTRGMEPRPELKNGPALSMAVALAFSAVVA